MGRIRNCCRSSSLDWIGRVCAGKGPDPVLGLITSNRALANRFNYAADARQLAATQLESGSGPGSGPGPGLVIFQNLTTHRPQRSVGTSPPCEPHTKISIRIRIRITFWGTPEMSKMILQNSGSWTLCGALLLFVLPLIPTPEALQHTEEGLEMLFRERSQSDWENVWHQETHSRCRDKLVRQLYWACEKDIYRLTRRNKKRTGNDEAWIKKRTTDPDGSTWLHVNYANMFLRSRRADGHTPSISNECCTKVGCTWEEYAEYCPSNKRRNHY